MEVEFADDALDRLETDLSFTMGLSRALVKVYRKRMQFIRNATDERDFYAMASLHFEKLKGDRSHQRSVRLNDQFRLVLELIDGEKKVVRIVEIGDYH